MSDHPHHARGLGALALILAVAVPACALNESGNIRATKFGDTSHVAERGSPTDALRTACGSGEATPGGAVIVRQPYLQQVTTSSAIVGWVSTAPAGERVDVSLPDGTPVTSADADLEKTVVRKNGENQMWAQLTGLAPNTTYCYAVAGETPLVGRTGFRTAPTADDPGTIGVLAFGDSGGGGADQYALRDQMSSYPFQLMIHTGDIAYDDGTIAQFEDNVFDVYAGLFRNIPFFPIAGNHDYNTQGGAPFRAVFALPGDGQEKWYSYDWGRVHFVGLDTEADYATQAAWLERDLAASPLPWKIVYLHKPMYSSGDHGSDMALRAKLEPIFQKHHVQLVLAGHDHDYERMIPQHGIAYVVTGGGGRGTRNVGTGTFTAFSDEVIHFVYLEIGVDQLVLHAIDATGVEFDSMVVPR